jgi:hypothetical protein
LSKKAVRVRVVEKQRLSELLAKLEQEVSQTLELITHHRNILSGLDEKEVDAETIQIMLAQLESHLVLQLQEREKLRNALAALNHS